MQAVVLVGGEGTRLRPLTYTTPKPLLPIGNRPFLFHQLDWLASHGVTDVVLAIGYQPDAFAGLFAGDRQGPVRVRFAVEPEPLGTAGAVRFAAAEAGFAGRVIVCNGDVLTDCDVTALLRLHEEAGAVATIALTEVEDPSAFGVVPTDHGGRVLGFVEKPAPGEAPTNLVNAGTYVLEPAVLAVIPAGRSVSIERETFPGLLAAGQALFALASPGYWLDIGTPEKYLQANRDRPGAPCEASGVHPGAKIDRSVVAPGATVGDGATVVCSVLHEGAVVETGARVIDSVVGPGAKVGAGAEVAEMSLLGAGVVVPPGARLAGARLGGPPTLNTGIQDS